MRAREFELLEILRIYSNFWGACMNEDVIITAAAVVNRLIGMNILLMQKLVDKNVLSDADMREICNDDSIRSALNELMNACESDHTLGNVVNSMDQCLETEESPLSTSAKLNRQCFSPIPCMYSSSEGKCCSRTLCRWNKP